MKVLVTGAGGLLGQGIIASLQRSGLKAHIVAADPSPLSAGLYWADSAHLVEMADSDKYQRSIERVLRRERPDVLLVGSDPELMHFARERNAIRQEFGTEVVVSSPDVIDIANDKWLTVEFLRNAGFAYARSALPGTENSLIEEVGFPLVVKPRTGSRSKGVRIVRDRFELRSALRSTQRPIIQELLGSDDAEYTASIISFDGDSRASIVMRRELRDGNTYRAFVEPYPDLNREVQRIASRLRPYGPVNVQFRIHSGRVVPFEINGRFSGTTPLRALAGFNEVEIVIRHVLFGEPVKQPEFSPVVILRNWSETVVQPWQIGQLRSREDP